MKTILLALGKKLLASIYGVTLSSSHPDMARAAVAAADVESAIIAEYNSLYAAIDSFPVPGDQAYDVAKIAFVWSMHEAGWWANPKGDNDKMGACGTMQVHVSSVPKGWLPTTWTCSALRADRVLGFRAGIRVIRMLEGKCGSLRAAMTAYSTDGSCPKKGWTLGLVTKRMMEAEVTP